MEDVLLCNKNYYYETAYCPACNNKSKVYFTVRSFEYLKCDHCGTIFEKQRPTKNGANILYNSVFSNYFRDKVEISSFFGKSPEKYSMSKRNLEILRKQLFQYISNDRLSLLDYASGLGVISDFYQKTGKFREVYYYEINDYSISFIKNTFNKLKLYRKGKIVDLVIFYAALEHFSDPYGTLKEIYDTLAPGGIIQIFIPYMGPITRKYIPNMFGMLNTGSHVNFFTENGIKQLGNRLNMKLLDIKYLSSNSHYLLKFLYAKKAYMTYKFIFHNNLELDSIESGYMMNNKFYNSTEFGNFFIRNSSKILNKLNLNYFLKLLDKGACMSLILKK
jgi:SAM-dependent methyltransferase